MPLSKSGAALALLATLAALPAAAEQRHMSATGGKLAIDTSCARSVSIQLDQSLNGRVEMLASAADAHELDQLIFDSESGGGARLHLAPNTQCWPGGLIRTFEPTMDIVLRVPARLPISIDESGSVTYRIGPVGGPLELDISGSVDLTAASTTSVTAELSGSGKVVIAGIDGRLKLEKSGSAEFRVGAGALDEANLELSGSGPVTLDTSSIENLDLQSSGSAQVTAGGRIGRASIELSGSGDVTLAGNQVDALKVDSSGGAELRVNGPVGDANIEISGSGDVYLPRVTGSLTKDSSGSGEVHIGTK